MAIKSHGPGKMPWRAVGCRPLVLGRRFNGENSNFVPLRILCAFDLQILS